MNDLHARLTNCFAVVFPDLGPEEIPRASRESLGTWDSMATVTLMSVLEEEFAIEVGPEDLPQLASFDRVRDYVRSKFEAVGSAHSDG